MEGAAADLAEDDSMYNYYEEGENKTGLLHLDADGKEIKRIEFSQTDEDGNSFYVSSFFVDNSGNVYLSDWQNVYIYDQDGNKKTTVDLGENGGDLCELKAGVVGVSYYKNDEAKPEESGRVFQEIDPATGKLAGDDIQSQTRQSLTNVKNILEAAGASMADVVETTVLLADINEFGAINEIYAEFFEAPYPARAAFQVAALPGGGKVEIKAVARV